MNFKAIAVDGPAGAGKSTIVKKISQMINYKYIDTGAMYRTVGLKVLNMGLSTKIREDVISVLENLDMKIEFEDDKQIVYLDGINVNDKIRTQEVSKGSSEVAVFKEVRIKLVEIQRELSKSENIIMDGRDIGTNVLPHADYKIYLTASVESRAKRRFEDLQKEGIQIPFEDVEKTIKERDYQDTNRKFAPLSVAKDAIVIDTTDMTIDDVVNRILSIIKA